MDKRDKKRRLDIKRNRRYTYCILTIILLILVFSIVNINSKVEEKKLKKEIGQIEDISEDEVLKKQSNISGNEKLENKKLEKSKIVVIDPGHGGFDGGATANSGELEKEIVLDISLKVGKILEKNNIRVKYTRSDDNINWPSSEQKNLEARAQVANDIGADVFISVHCNYLEEFSVKGVETWCRIKNTPSEDLAKEILNELGNVKYTSKRAVKYENEGYLAILNAVNAPATLIELGFLSNEEDVSILKTDEGKEKIAEGIAKGIINYIKLNKSDNELNSSEE